MTIVTEIARFLLTAIAIAIAIPSGLAILAIFGVSPMSADAFFGLGAISFFLAIVGGIVVGLPALWIGRRLEWQHSLARMTPLGAVAGAIAAALLTVPFFEGEMSFAVNAMPGFAVFGGFAGLVAAPVWVLLHRSGVRAQEH